MPEKRPNIRQERFLQVVEKLDLANQNALVIEKTKENAGNVSNYLSGKKPPSKNFLKKFSVGFNIPPSMFTYPYTNSEGWKAFSAKTEIDPIVTELKATIKRLETENSRLLAEVEKLDKRVESLLSMLNNQLQKA